VASAFIYLILPLWLVILELELYCQIWGISSCVSSFILGDQYTRKRWGGIWCLFWHCFHYSKVTKNTIGL